MPVVVPAVAALSRGAVEGVLVKYASQFAKLQKAIASLIGSFAPPGGSAPILPQVAHETVYLTPDATQVDVLSPIFLGFFGYFFVFLLTGISFLRERIGGTLERLLAIGRLDHLVSVPVQDSAQHAAQVELVIGEDDTRFLRHHVRSAL